MLDPTTGDFGRARGSPPGRGYSIAAAVVAYFGSRTAGPLACAAPIGAPRPRDARMPTPRVYTMPVLMTGPVRPTRRRNFAPSPGNSDSTRPPASCPAFLRNRFSSRSRPATRLLLIASTTPLTGALLATISPTEPMTTDRPRLIFTSSKIVLISQNAKAAMITVMMTSMTNTANDMRPPLCVREGDVERAPVVGDGSDDLADVVLRR